VHTYSPELRLNAYQHERTGDPIQGCMSGMATRTYLLVVLALLASYFVGSCVARSGRSSHYVGGDA
jgi:hypothetical protein